MNYIVPTRDLMPTSSVSEPGALATRSSTVWFSLCSGD
jgi:hypothetical protein